MGERCEESALTRDTTGKGRAAPAEMGQFQRDPAREKAIGALGKPHRRHATLADLAQQAVGSDAPSWRGHAVLAEAWRRSARLKCVFRGAVALRRMLCKRFSHQIGWPGPQRIRCFGAFVRIEEAPQMRRENRLLELERGKPGKTIPGFKRDRLVEQGRKLRPEVGRDGHRKRVGGFRRDAIEERRQA